MKAVHVAMMDPSGTVVEAFRVRVNLRDDEDSPGDPHAYDLIAARTGQFLAAMGSEGLECSVTIREAQ